MISTGPATIEPTCAGSKVPNSLPPPYKRIIATKENGRLKLVEFSHLRVSIVRVSIVRKCRTEWPCELNVHKINSTNNKNRMFTKSSLIKTKKKDRDYNSKTWKFI